MPDPDMSDQAGSRSKPRLLPTTGEKYPARSKPDPPNSPDIRPDPDLDPVHPYY